MDANVKLKLKLKNKKFAAKVTVFEEMIFSKT